MIEHPKIDCSFLTSFFWVFLAFVTNTISPRVVSDINLRYACEEVGKRRARPRINCVR